MRNLKGRLIKLLATGFGIGFAPLAPGTAGTMAGIPLFLILSFLPLPFQLLSIVIFTVAAVYLAQAAETSLRQHDPPCIVIDEITGFLWTMLLVPAAPHFIFFGFILFRFFDIIKPWPIRRLQYKLPGGWGIVGDDVVAGICGNLALRFLINYSVL